MKKICSWLLYKLWGWKKTITVEHPKKYIICLAPHTSNWDFVLGQLYSYAEDIKPNFLMKKEWFFWPLGPIFKHIGGIPVYRQKNMSMTESLAHAAINTEDFRLTITPEGTRSANADWKRGFYFIAYKANIPILLYGIDYEKKEIVCTKSFTPTGDWDKDIVEIKSYFKDFKGKKPEKFAI